jgi:hypothetical protein
MPPSPPVGWLMNTMRHSSGVRLLDREVVEIATFQ